MSKKEVLLSFCIPTYKRKKKVIECIKEIQKIKNENIEIIICDNASQDGTKEEIVKLKKRDNRIVYIENDINIGAVANITKALSKGSGKYLYLISDEDLVNIDFIEKILLQEILSDEADIILGSIYNIITDKFYQRFINNTSEIINDKNLEILLYNNYMSGIVLKQKKINFLLLNKYSNNSENLYPHILATLTMLNRKDNIILKKYKDSICFMRDEEKTLITQNKEGKTIKYWSPTGRIEQLKFMVSFIKKEILFPNYQITLYKKYGQIYSNFYMGDLFKDNFMGDDYRKEKKYFYEEVKKISEIKKYFYFYIRYNTIKKFFPERLLKFIRKIKNNGAKL